MIYIKYPLNSLNLHPRLVMWHQTPDGQKDWKILRPYLTAHLLVPHSTQEVSSKCWYTEMIQLDKNVQDVEHFRPKEISVILPVSQRTKIEQQIGYTLPEETTQSHYNWLKLNHNNYRFVSGLPNRAGGKHRTFPILLGTTRLAPPDLPNGRNEFPLLLDPTIEHDANLLLVIPSGEILPKANHAVLTVNDIMNCANAWQADPFNFLRSWVSIIVYQLNDSNLITARKGVFQKVIALINRLEQFLGKSHEITIFICQEIRDLISCFSPFALAARCALLSYDANRAVDINLGQRVQSVLSGIYNNVVQRERSAN